MNNNDSPPNKSRRDFISKLLMSGGLLASSALIIRHGIDYIFPSMEAPPLKKLGRFIYKKRLLFLTAL